MWYVIHTKTGYEQQCLERCEQYIDASAYNKVFIPQFIAQKHFKKEWHDVKKVLFPGYLFVDTETIEPVIAGLKKFRQYSKVLRDGEVVSPITKEEQAFLSLLMDSEYTIHYSQGLLIGDKVCVTQGPLKNIQGYVKSIDRHRRIAKLEVPFFGRPTPIEIGFGAIMRVSDEQFHEMKSANMHNKSPDECAGQVKVLKGIFKGMYGTFLYADVKHDEWTVEIDLFDVKTKVIFQRNEIKMFI